MKKKSDQTTISVEKIADMLGVYGNPATHKLVPKDARVLGEEEANNLRLAVARYMYSEGCGCCESDSHPAAQAVLCELVGIPKFDDDSGYDYYSVLTKETPNENH